MYLKKSENVQESMKTLRASFVISYRIIVGLPVQIDMQGFGLSVENMTY